MAVAAVASGGGAVAGAVRPSVPPAARSFVALPLSGALAGSPRGSGRVPRPSAGPAGSGCGGRCLVRRGPGPASGGVRLCAGVRLLFLGLFCCVFSGSFLCAVRCCVLPRGGSAVSVLFAFGSRSVRSLPVPLSRFVFPGCCAVWSGGASGADSLCAASAVALGLSFRCWPARWAVLGRGAGFARSAALVAALPPGSRGVVFCACPLPAPGVRLSSVLSPGAAFSVARCLAAGVPVSAVFPCGAVRSVVCARSSVLF